MRRLTDSSSFLVPPHSLLIAGESRVTALLKSKADELHRVRTSLYSRDAHACADVHLHACCLGLLF